MQGNRDARTSGLSQTVQMLLLLGIGIVVGSLLSGLLTTPAALYAQSASPLTIQPDTGRVGIGTTVPIRTLEVGSTAGTPPGNALFSGSTGQDIFVGIRSNRSWDLVSRAAGRFDINDAAVTRFSITSNGDVGIGTTGPQRLLHISKASTPELAITNTGNAVDAKNFQFQLDGSGNLNFHMVNDAWNTVTAQMTMLRNGNVGIGTVNPSSTLHVAGDIRASGGDLIYSCPTLGGSCGIGTDWCAGQLQLGATCQYCVAGVGNLTANCTVVGRLVKP